MRKKQREKSTPASAVSQEFEDPMAAKNQTSEDEEPLIEGMASLGTQISNAKTSGKLVISGRSLTTFPEKICSTLLPRNSSFHPGNRKSGGKAPAVVLDMDYESDKWYEERPLTALLANSNEFQELPEAIGGFEELTTLDLRSNLLTTSSLPNSLMSLASLTSLNLANNRLDRIPTQLLALESLISLDLSGNNISQLWSKSSWREDLESLQKDCRESQRDMPGPDDTFSTESEVSTDFWSTFPSSPAPKSRGASEDATITSDAPFPRLKTLNLSNNQLTHATILGTIFPPGLINLDLSRNPLGSTDPLALDAPPFDQLDQLQTLNLSRCELEAIQPASHFTKMRELDLSGNTLDVLNSLPVHLQGQSGARKRTVKMTGLPRALEGMNRDFAQGTDEVVVRLSGNALGQEIVNRRSRKRGGGARDTPTSTRVLRSQTKATSQDQDEDQLTKQVSDLTISEESQPTASAASSSRTTTHSSGVFHFAEHYDSKTLTLQLSGQQLSTLPVNPDTSSEAPPVATLDLSRNQLQEVPFERLAQYGWEACLSRLDLSRNRLTSMQDTTPFAKLEHLTLASNMLSDASTLLKLSEACPYLLYLDLSTNFLFSLQGVEKLLLRPGGGLRTLRLGGNRLADLTQLVEVAERVRDGHEDWRCTTLELVSMKVVTFALRWIR